MQYRRGGAITGHRIASLDTIHAHWHLLMRIRNVAHRGLKRFIEHQDRSGLPSAALGKVRLIVSFLLYIQDEDELRTVRTWSEHQLTGDRFGTWSLTVTRNWRITFRVDRLNNEIVDLNYEDYH